MIILYEQNCTGCSGNHALAKVKQVCKQKNIEFQERRTIFWKVWGNEAKEIIKLNEGLKLPFFYNSETGDVLEGNSLTPLGTIEKWIENNSTK